MIDILLLTIPVHELRPYIVGISSVHTYLNNNNISCLTRDPVTEYYELIEKNYNNDLAKDLERSLQSPHSSQLLEGFTEYLKNIVITEKPKFIGLSALVSNRDASVAVAKILKKIFPEIEIILGGPIAKFLKESFHKLTSIDFLYTGEAESGFANFFNADLRYNLLGLSYRNKNNEVIHNNQALPADLLNLPIAYHDKLFKTKFHTENYKPYFPVVFSRGCPYHCTFCEGWKVLDGFRYFPIDKVMEFVRSYENDERYMLVEDSIINGNDKWLKAFCNAMIENNIKLTWGGMFRFHPMMEQEGYLDLLGRSGLKRLNFGLESGSPKILKNLGKFANMEKMFGIFNRLREVKSKYNIRISVMLMLGSPYEEEVDFQKTLKFLYFNRDVIDMIDACSAFVLNDDLTILHQLEKENLVVRKSSINWATPSSSPKIRIDRMKRMEKFCKQINLPVRLVYAGLDDINQNDWVSWPINSEVTSLAL